MRATKHLVSLFLFLLLIPVSLMADIMSRDLFKQRKRATGYLKVNRFMTIYRVGRCLLLITVLYAPACWGWPMSPDMTVGIDVIGGMSESGEIEMKVSLSAEELGSTEIQFSPWRGLQVEGDLLWQKDLTGKTEHTFVIRALIPDNDTSGFEMFITGSCGERTRTGMGAKFFVRTGDSLEVFEIPPHLQKERDRRIQKAERAAKPRTFCNRFDMAVRRKPVIDENRVTISFGVWLKSDYCDAVRIDFAAHEGVSLFGDTTWFSDRTENDSPVWKDVDIVVKPNDTSLVSVTATCSDSSVTRDITIVTTGDTTECWFGYPGTDRRGAIPCYPRKKATIESAGEVRRLPDTALARIAEAKFVARKQKRMESLAELEKTPCTKPRQWIAVCDELWERFEGEYKFHRVERPEQAPAEEAVQLAPALETHHIVVYIAEPDENEWTANIAQFYDRMERDGFYHGRTVQTTLDYLDSLNIPWAEYPEYPEIE